MFTLNSTFKIYKTSLIPSRKDSFHHYIRCLSCITYNPQDPSDYDPSDAECSYNQASSNGLSFHSIYYIVGFKIFSLLTTKVDEHKL